MITRLYHHKRGNDSVVINLLNVSLVFQNHHAHDSTKGHFPNDIIFRDKSGKDYTVDGFTLEEVQEHIEQAHAYHYSTIRGDAAKQATPSDKTPKTLLDLDIE